MDIYTAHNQECHISALFDTGAVTSVVSTAAFLWFQRQGAVKKPIPVTDLALTAANGSPLRIAGAHVIHFGFKGQCLHGVFVTVPDLQSSVIIGMNVISAAFLTLVPGTTDVVIRRPKNDVTWTQAICTVDQDRQWLQADIRVHTAISILPQTAIRVKCLLTDTSPGNRPIGPNTPFFGDVDGLPIHSITDATGHCLLYVSNPSSDMRYLARTDQVGNASNHTLWERTELTAQLATSLFGRPPDTSQISALGRHRGGASRQHVQVSTGKQMAIRQKVAETVPKEHQRPITDLLLRFADVFSDHPMDLGLASAVTHDIQLRDQEPVYVKQFPLAPDEMDLIRRSLSQWLEAGLIEPARSKYNSPVFVIRKKDSNDMRCVLDYRLVNAKSLPDRYSIRSVDECLTAIGHAGSKVFTAVDLSSSFWQMPLADAARPYTAFTVSGSGQYQWKVGAMGLMGCPASFSRLMDKVVENLDNVLTYIDDGLVHSADRTAHVIHLEAVLQRFRAHNLRLNLNKCVFAADSLAYLGHTLTPRGVMPGVDKTKALRETLPPQTRTALKSFLGVANFFRQYIRGFSQLSAPLHRLCSNSSGWSRGPLPEEELRAFRSLQAKLTSSPVRPGRENSTCTSTAPWARPTAPGEPQVSVPHCSKTNLRDPNAPSPSPPGPSATTSATTALTFWSFRLPCTALSISPRSSGEKASRCIPTISP